MAGEAGAGKAGGVEGRVSGWGDGGKRLYLLGPFSTIGVAVPDWRRIDVFGIARKWWV